MPEDHSRTLDSVWQHQPADAPIHLETFIYRRSERLDSATRSEILMSFGAALFFIAVMAWRFPFLIHDRIPQIGFAGVLAWALLSLYLFRDLIWSRGAVPKDALAVPSLEHYRKSLARRRDHLRNAWLWHGPLFLACVIFVALLIEKQIIAFGGPERVLPLVVLLGAWTAFGFTRRLRQAGELQREIDDLEPR